MGDSPGHGYPGSPVRVQAQQTSSVKEISLLAARIVAANRMANFRSSTISLARKSPGILPPGMTRPCASNYFVHLGRGSDHGEK